MLGFFFNMANEFEDCVFPQGQETPDPESGLMPGLGVREIRFVKRDL